MADFVFGPVCLDQKSFISALDNCSNRYRRLEGRELTYETDKLRSHEKANLAVRIQPPVPRSLRGPRAPNQDGRASCFPKETAQGLGAKYTAKMAGLEAVQSIGDTLF